MRGKRTLSVCIAGKKTGLPILVDDVTDLFLGNARRELRDQISEALDLQYGKRVRVLERRLAEARRVIDGR